MSVQNCLEGGFGLVESLMSSRSSAGCMVCTNFAVIVNDRNLIVSDTLTEAYQHITLVHIIEPAVLGIVKEIRIARENTVFIVDIEDPLAFPHNLVFYNILYRDNVCILVFLFLGQCRNIGIAEFCNVHGSLHAFRHNGVPVEKFIHHAFNIGGSFVIYLAREQALRQICIIQHLIKITVVQVGEGLSRKSIADIPDSKHKVTFLVPFLVAVDQGSYLNELFFFCQGTAVSDGFDLSRHTAGGGMQAVQLMPQTVYIQFVADLIENIFACLTNLGTDLFELGFDILSELVQVIVDIIESRFLDVQYTGSTKKLLQDTRYFFYPRKHRGKSEIESTKDEL